MYYDVLMEDDRRSCKLEGMITQCQNFGGCLKRVREKRGLLEAQNVTCCANSKKHFALVLHPTAFCPVLFVTALQKCQQKSLLRH